MTTSAPVSSEAKALDYARATRTRAVAELREFVRRPSVSAQGESVARCGAWLAGHLRHIGLRDASLVPTAGNPIVVATWQRARGRPTLLIYGHYDVQPPEPLSAWASPPFDAALRDGYVYRARRIRRQGTAVLPREGDRGVAHRLRSSPVQRGLPVRGRGGDGQPASRGVPTRQPFATESRWSRCLGHVDARRRSSGDHLFAARRRQLRIGGAVGAGGPPLGSVRRSTLRTRRPNWRASWPAYRTATAG